MSWCVPAVSLCLSRVPTSPNCVRSKKKKEKLKTHFCVWDTCLGHVPRHRYCINNEVFVPTLTPKMSPKDVCFSWLSPEWCNLCKMADESQAIFSIIVNLYCFQLVMGYVERCENFDQHCFSGSSF